MKSLVTASATQIDISTENNVVKNAVILAAGKSSRFRESGVMKPKVLMKLGGLRLLERSILTLHSAGVEHFRIVVGAYRDQVVPEMKALKSLRDIDVEYVVAEDYEKGNGVSFGVGAAGFDEPFLLTMSDHIFSTKTITDFVDLANEKPHLPALACDPELEDVFDMDDATKVASNDGFIGNIGKQIETYDLVDTGLFYFPKKYGKRIGEMTARGANSVSNVIQAFIEESGVRAISLAKPFWQDVDNPDMKGEAERRLMRTLTQPTDGWVSRKINRPISTRLTFLLAKFGVHPNVVTTLAFLLTMVGAYFAGSGVYENIVLGALIFQLSSILDGCDGELARLTFKSTKFGAWYGQLAGNLRYIVFFGALGVSAWLSTGSQVYLFAVFMLVALAIYMLSQIISFAWNRRHEEPQPLIPAASSVNPKSSLFGSVYNIWRKLNGHDVLAFATFLFCIIFLYQAMFWLALLGTTATAIMVSRSVTASQMQKEGAASTIFDKIDPIFFYLLGIVILSALVLNMDFAVVTESLSQVGNKVFLVFSVAIIWILANTMCIRTLVDKKVSFVDLLFNQMTGDAYNQIIPLAGLGGEPYKIKHLTQWLDWHTASRAIVVDRLIHATSGMLFSSLGVGAMLMFVDEIPSGYFIPLLIMAIFFALGSFVMVWLSLSKAPSKIAGYVLKKLKIVEEYRNDPIPARRFFQAFFFKFIGRAFNLVEIFVMFSLFNIEPSFISLLAVAGMVSMSATLFFIIPQGLGVNETGISLALGFLGFPAALGITFGLIRRARMIFWALFGVGLHVAVSVVKRFAVSRA